MNAAQAPLAERAEERQRRLALLANLREAAVGLELSFPEDESADTTPIPMLRRRRLVHLEDRVELMKLVKADDGTLTWGEALARPGGADRRRRLPRRRGGEVVTQVRFERLLPEEVLPFIEKLDEKLTPTQGLSRWDGQNLVRPAGRLDSTRRTLLFIHGTFGDSKSALQDLSKTFLDAAGEGAQVVAFEHRCLSLSPLLNALDLARELSDFSGPLDVVCHGRGGLVARWWLEVLAPTKPRRRCRVVFVGAPLGGTSLATPYRLRSALHFATNIANALGGTGERAPVTAGFLAVALGLMKVIVSLSNGVGSPLADAVVPLVPGLACQRRDVHNAELTRLHQGTGVRPGYHAITSEFCPPDEPPWAFWQSFTGKAPGGPVTGPVFEGKNDMMVDTDSMTLLFPASSERIEGDRVLSFGSTDHVHHLSYFRQERTRAFLSKVFRNH